MGWRVSELVYPFLHSTTVSYNIIMCYMYTVYSGMQEWVIQIPSIPILVSVLFPSLDIKNITRHVNPYIEIAVAISAYWSTLHRLGSGSDCESQLTSLLLSAFKCSLRALMAFRRWEMEFLMAGSNSAYVWS